MEQIESKQDLNDAIVASQEKSVFILKHSTRCPISAGAFKAFETFSQKNPNIACLWINVIESRPLSENLAEISRIKHQSPQVIVYRGGKPIWNASHQAITLDSLSEHRV